MKRSTRLVAGSLGGPGEDVADPDNKGRTNNPFAPTNSH
jgi:hypothetical protein